MNEISTFIIKRNTRGLPGPLLPSEDTKRRWPSHHTVNLLDLDIKLPVSRTVRNQFLLFRSHPWVSGWLSQ